MVKGIYAKNTLLFKQKHDKSEIHKYGDYFIIFNWLILDLLFIANSRWGCDSCLLVHHASK